MFVQKEKGIQRKAEFHHDARVADIEKQTDISFKDVKIHYASCKPKKFNALAYAYGNDVHLGPGQEKLLRHELGHVLQQRQGIVKPTMRLHGYPINNETTLEKDANNIENYSVSANQNIKRKVMQRAIGFEFQMLDSSILKIIPGNDPYTKLFKTTRDDRNIEMYTNPLDSIDQVIHIIEKMSEKAHRILDAKTKKKEGIFGITFDHKDKTSGKAQPQINADIDFTQAIKLDEIYNRAGQLGLFAGEDFHWQKEKTFNTIQATIQAANIIRLEAEKMNIVEILLKSEKGKGKSSIVNQEQIDYPMAAHNIVGLAQLIASQYVQSQIENRQYERANTHYDKDIPVLIKTSFQDSMESINKRYSISTKVIFDVLNNLISKATRALQIEFFDLKFYINDDNHIYSNPYMNKVPLRPIEKENAFLAIAEFRRAPSIHFNNWIHFAVNAFQELDKYKNPNKAFVTSTSAPVKRKKGK